jgi:tetratricopeptide (TPR) repeat protein
MPDGADRQTEESAPVITDETSWKAYFAEAQAASQRAWKEGRLADAEPIMLAAVRVAEAPGADPNWLIESLQRLIWVYHRLYWRPEKTATLTRLLTVQEAHLGPDHPDLVGTLTSLAWQLGGERRTDEGEAIYRRALAIDEATHGLEHPHVADCLRMLGVRLFFSKKYAESAACLERGRAIYERTDLDRNRNWSGLDAILGCLKLTYMAWEKYAEAEQALRRNLELSGRYDGDFLNSGQILEHLGDACQAQGKFDESIECYRRALVNGDRWFEQNRRAKRFRPAARWARSGLRSARHRTHGWRLYQIGISLRGLGREHDAKASLYQAERSLRKALRIERGGSHDLGVSETMRCLAEVLIARGKIVEGTALKSESESLYHAALARHSRNNRSTNAG